MARQFFAIEKGLRLFKENSDTEFIDLIFDAGPPLGTGGETAAAPIGSQYNDRTNGKIYVKQTDTDLAADWIDISASGVQIDELSWRNEKVRFATGDTLAAGTVDITTLTDNEGMVIGDINVGEYALGDVDGTPALFEITAKPGGDQITLAAAGQAIADNDTFMVQQYLPDSPASQEGQSIIHFPLASGAGVKVGDVNWDFADGINLNGYVDQTGAVDGNDTVQSAIQKIEKGLKDALSALGIARNATDFGVWVNGALVQLTANATAKVLFQRIGDLLAQLRGVQVAVPNATLTVVDSVPVASVKTCKWIVEAFETATPVNIQAFEIFAVNDGTTADDSKSKILKLGASFNLSVSVNVVATNMELQAQTTTAGVTVTARRIEVVKNTLP